MKDTPTIIDRDTNTVVAEMTRIILATNTTLLPALAALWAQQMLQASLAGYPLIAEKIARLALTWTPPAKGASHA